MRWEPVKRSLQGFDDFIAQQKICIASDAQVSPQFAIVREYLNDHDQMDEPAVLAKWNDRFNAFYDAVIVVYRLTDAVVSLSHRPGPLRRRLVQVLSGPLAQDFVPQQAKDFLYELEVAAALRKAGFSVALREPDVVVSGGGLSRELGLACKYPSSEAQIHEHISKGYRQITKQNLGGCVVLGLDLIITRAAFDSVPKFFDFRQGRRHPRDVANQLVGDAMTSLVAQRGKD